MTFAEAMISELEQEAVATRKVLERIPESEFGWKPHPKSFSMGELASHLAQMAEWGLTTVTTDGIDFDPAEHKPWIAASSQDLLAKFDGDLEKCLASLRGKTDAQLQENWTMKIKGAPQFSMPKTACLRMWVLNHLVHHRGQLTVYLRMRDIPVPSIYGPSADER